MVATSIHYIVGVYLAHLLGYKDNKKYWLGLIAVIPDLDGIILTLLFGLKRIFGFSLGFLEASEFGVQLFAHRGISHSLSLLAVALLVSFFVKADKKTIKLMAILWSSHLFLDFITAWKFFPLLPFSYSNTYFALVEVFDSVFVFLSMLILAFLVGNSLLHKHKYLPPVFAYVFVSLFGFFPSVFMGEFNLQTLLLSQIGFWVIVLMCFFQRESSSKKKHLELTKKGASVLALILVFYLSLLTANKVIYSNILGTSIVNIEPLEEFAFNFNAHTFEMETEKGYSMGIISWRGVENEKIISKINNPDNIPQKEIDKFIEAYPRSIHVNWFNHPVWTFYEDEQGVYYANIRYAKSFLDTEHIPGPKNGMEVELNSAGILISYGEGWFD